MTNASSKRTKELIKKTFAELMDEKKELSKITVTELVNKAGITRGAFYFHYDNIYNVVEDFQNETLQIFLCDEDEFKSINDLDKFFDKIFTYLKENEEIYTLMFKSDEPLLFTYKLNKIINKKLLCVLPKENDLALNISFFTDGCINLVIKYFRNEVDTTLDNINAYMKKIVKKLF